MITAIKNNPLVFGAGVVVGSAVTYACCGGTTKEYVTVEVPKAKKKKKKDKGETK